MTTFRIDLERFSDNDAPACIALANSIEWRGTDRATDLATDADGLLRWARRWRLAPEPQLARLQRRVPADAPQVADALRALRALRDDVHALLAGAARGDALPADRLERLESQTKRLMARLRIRADGPALRTELADAPNPWRFWEAAAVLSTLAVLSAADRGRLKVCEDTRGCGWLFIDTTRNGARRYCSEESCGNYARQQRFRARVH
ncbi:MAG TPA: CGNR zinc finger domain-containing protein, partial [Burkholderiaceae bacterium]|nr:CGNR zinc finger domain-containing protein [Burkholderiaceae bacterium]